MMKQIKTLWVLVAALCATPVVTSCGGDDGDSGTPAPPPSTTVVNIADDILMTDSYLVYANFGETVAGFHYAFLPKTSVAGASEEQVIEYLKQQNRNTVSSTSEYKRIYGYGINANTQGVLYIICYDRSGNYGPLTTREFTTKRSTTTWDAAISVSYTTSTWDVTISKQSLCSSYYVLYTTDASLASEFNSAPNALLAAQIKEHKADTPDYEPYTNNSTGTFARSSALFIMTWGMNSAGQTSGNIRTAYKTAYGYAPAVGAPQTDSNSWQQGYDDSPTDNRLQVAAVKAM